MDSQECCAADIWSIAAARLKEQNENLFQHWFRKITPLALKDETLKLGVSDDFFASILEEQYDDLLLGALAGINGVSYHYQFEPGHEPAQEKPVPATGCAPGKTAKEGPGRKIINPQNTFGEHTFENFTVDAENVCGYAVARAVADAPGKRYNPLFLYGVSGSGKTHLLHAIAAELRRNSSKTEVCLITCDEMLNEFYFNLLEKKSLSSFRLRLRDIDILLVDDVQRLSGKRQMQIEFLNVFNFFYNRNKQIVFTSDRQPCEIEKLDKQLETRFEQGMVAEVCPPEYEARLSILHRMRSETLVQNTMDDTLLEFLAKNISSNVSRLRGAFIRLASYASFSGKGVLSIEQAEKLLQSQLVQECSARDLSIDQIQQAVANYFGIQLSDLLGERRRRSVAEPRMIAMYLSRELTQSSSNEVGSAFRRNHATVLHAEKKVPELASSDENIRRAISQIKRQLQKK